jgi:hypothetical protein
MKRTRDLPLAAWLTCLGLLGCGTIYPVVTQHNDAMRTGVYGNETVLTPGAVDPRTGPGMVLRTWRPVDGEVNAQVLFAPGLSTPTGRHDAVFVFTEHNVAYAYDLAVETDPGTTAGLIWSVTLPARPGLSTPVGIHGTPVLDLATNTVYLVYGISNGLFPWDGQGDTGYLVEFHLAALDIRTGALLRDTVVAGSAPSSVAPSPVVFMPQRQIQRGGLLLTPNPFALADRTIYIPFASRWREETHNWHGWVFGYDAATFAPRGVFCATPDRRANSEGGGIWQGGAGLAADSDWNVYFNTGNGPGTGNDHGNSIVKLKPTLTSGAYGFSAFAFSAAADDPAHATEWANNDIDLAGGGVTVIPDSAELVGGGKTGVLYVMDRRTMTKVQSFAAFTNTYDPSLRYNDWMSGPHLHGAPTYWKRSATEGILYHWSEKDTLKRFNHDRITGLLTTVPAATGDVTAERTLMPGGLISLSSNGDHDGILWITLPTSSPTNGGRIFAYDALSLRRLWDTTVAGGVSHSNPPTVAAGRVLVAEPNGEVLVYGLADRAVPVSRPMRPPPYPPLGPDPGPWIPVWMSQLPVERAQAIMPPKGQRPAFLARCKGSSLYQARRDAAGTLGWEWVGAKSELIDVTGIQPNLAIRGLGHVLARLDGLTLAAAHSDAHARLTAVATVPAPNQGDAPWVLFSVKAESADPIWGSVTYAQQLRSKAGRAPDAPPEKEGATAEAPFEAAYVFYMERL